MSVETFSITALLKYLWLSIVPLSVYLFKRQEKLKEDTYTKKETQDIIDNKVAPILVELKYSQTSLEENTAAVKSLSIAVVDLRVAYAKDNGNNK